MEGAYNILKDNEQLKIQVAVPILERASYIYRELGEADPVNKVRTELMIGTCTWNGVDTTTGLKVFREDIVNASLEKINEGLKYLSTNDKRCIFITLSDIWNQNRDRFDPLALQLTDADILIMVNDYIEFKSKIDDVAPEVSEEVDRIANMSDEEFEESLKEDDEEESEEEEEEEDGEETEGEESEDPEAGSVSDEEISGSCGCDSSCDGGACPIVFDNPVSPPAEPEPVNGIPVVGPYDIPDEKLYDSKRDSEE